MAREYCNEVIDFTKNPTLAAGNQIFAVPTLVRRFAGPIRKIIGNLSEERLLVGLAVQSVKAGDLRFMIYDFSQCRRRRASKRAFPNHKP